GVPGFAYLSDRVQVTAGEPAAAAWMAGATWAQTRSYPAVVEAAPATVSAVQPGPAGESPGNVTVPQYTPGHIQVVTNATRPALLVLAESLAPGWRATLDGHPVDILRTNYLSQGVVVPAGTHTVELRYFPDSLLYGGLVSGAGLLGFVALIVWAWRRQPALVPALAPVDGAVGVGA
ncbi:MAG TPA: YfhO family protein, partial [Chloroflexia bacterium]|nr:YfhO family protein [Chloroflexia bacterium]